MSINIKDLETLEGHNWLNDEIINSYMKLICMRSRELVKKSTANKNVYAFSTFFFMKLANEGYTESLERWTRKVNFLDYDLVLMPVHRGYHWTLLVIDNNSSEIRYYDSFNGKNVKPLFIIRFLSKYAFFLNNYEVLS